MTEPGAHQQHPVAIGGIGGSGTRLGAGLLQLFGYYIGDDLNEALDNLWFTLLFKRRTVLTECEPDLHALIALFFSRMTGETSFSDEQRARILRLTQDARLQHPQDWLHQRAASFLSGTCLRRAGQPWGWKEPNTHIIIDRLLGLHPDLRYMHFIRHPIDMAMSANQNQLENWGPILLNRNVANEPRQSLAYWCAAHRRLNVVVQRWSERIMVVAFDDLCANPQRSGALIADFVGAAIPDRFRLKLDELIDHNRASTGRYKKVDLTQFAADDISYIKNMGYAVT